MTLDQILGPLRAILPVVCTLLVGWGLMPADIAAEIPEAVYQTVVAVSSLVTLGMAIWSWWTNRRAAMAAKVAATRGVKVVVTDAAPADMKALAVDPKAPDVLKASEVAIRTGGP